MTHRYSEGAAAEPLLPLPGLGWLGPGNDLSQEEESIGLPLPGALPTPRYA